jgi:hypothetical protein
MVINHQSTMDQPWINYNGHNSLPSGKRLHNYGKSQFLMGKSFFPMGHFQQLCNKLPEGNHIYQPLIIHSSTIIMVNMNHGSITSYGNQPWINHGSTMNQP